MMFAAHSSLYPKRVAISGFHRLAASLMECCPPLLSTRLDSGEGVRAVSDPSTRSLPADTHAPSKAFQTLRKKAVPRAEAVHGREPYLVGNPIKPGVCQIPAQSRILHAAEVGVSVRGVSGSEPQSFF